jgi:hypothetical protein
MPLPHVDDREIDRGICTALCKAGSAKRRAALTRNGNPFGVQFLHLWLRPHVTLGTLPSSLLRRHLGWQMNTQQLEHEAAMIGH